MTSLQITQAQCLGHIRVMYKGATVSTMAIKLLGIVVMSEFPVVCKFFLHRPFLHNACICITFDLSVFACAVKNICLDQKYTQFLS